jgi:hypothetical protein
VERVAVIRKALHIVRHDGIGSLGSRAVAFAYRRGVRRWLPGHPVYYAGIPVAHDRKWGDRWVPSRWRPKSIEDDSEYEAALVGGLREHVRPGDRVVVIGGGVGVTATIAALQAGPTGHVRCFEGAREGVQKVKRTAALNGVAHLLTVEHGVVARAISVYGTAPERDVVRPEALPDCDVLELDCEGAEVDILQQMTIQPRVILVETHGLYGAPTALVSSLLEDRGFRVSDNGVAAPRKRAYCERKDIRVLVGVVQQERVGV